MTFARVLAIGCFLLSGCSRTIQTFQIQSAVSDFELSPRLCEAAGRRVAIVPGGAFSGGSEIVEHVFHVTAAGTYARAQSPGSLRYRVDDGSWHDLPGGTELPPEFLAALAEMLRDLGFEVIDRRHTQAVLNEQDLAAVFGDSAQPVGRLLDADILVIASLSFAPQVHFASHGGAYACMRDVMQKQQIEFVDVATGASLGTATASGSVLAVCGFRRAQAEAIGGPNSTRIVWRLDEGDGQWTDVSEVDFAAKLEEAGRRDEEETRAEWRRLCGRPEGR
jgi:hypothetical protein